MSYLNGGTVIVLILAAALLWCGWALTRHPLIGQRIQPSEMVAWRFLGVPSFDWELDIRWTDGSVVTYRGSHTVWRQTSDGWRVPTAMESWLSNKAAWARWERAKRLEAGREPDSFEAVLQSYSDVTEEP